MSLTEAITMTYSFAVVISLDRAIAGRTLNFPLAAFICGAPIHYMATHPVPTDADPGTVWTAAVINIAGPVLVYAIRTCRRIFADGKNPAVPA